MSKVGCRGDGRGKTRPRDTVPSCSFGILAFWGSKRGNASIRSALDQLLHYSEVIFVQLSEDTNPVMPGAISWATGGDTRTSAERR